MRRFLRPIAISAAAIVVAAGAMIGFAASADAGADASFTAHLTSVPTNQTSEIDFGGKKSSSSTLISERINIYDSFGITCDGTGTGSTNWSCADSFDGVGAGIYSVQIVEQNSNGSVVQNQFAFRLYDATDTNQSANQTAPAASYVFTPGAVTVKAAAVGPNDVYVATNILKQSGESYVPVSSSSVCPSSNEGTGSVSPFGNGDQLTSSVSCSATLPASSNSNNQATAGIYVVTNDAGVEGEGPFEDDQANAAFWVPHNSFGEDRAVPLSFTQDTTKRTVTVTGSVDREASSGSYVNGESNAGLVEILDDNNNVLCETSDYSFITETYSGFSCTTNQLDYGTHALRAVIVDNGMISADTAQSNIDTINGAEDGMYITGAMSAASNVGTANFPAPVVATPIPTATDLTPVWSFTIQGDLTNLHPGDTITINGMGLPAGTVLDTVLHSTPVDLGTVVAAADGTFTQTVTIPAGVPVGAHHIQVTATGPGLVPTTQDQPLTLNAVPGQGGKVVTVKPPGVKQGGTGADGSGAGIEPNILTKALTPFADVAVHPNKIVSAVEIGLVLLLLAVLPAHLLEATIAEQSERFERRFRRLPLRPSWMVKLTDWFKTAPVVAGLTVAVLTAVLFGFADPKFGFTLASLRLILACGIALFLVGYVANWLTAVIARNQWHITVLVNTRPYGLILTVIGVLVSRLLHFSPGFLIGLILGLTIQGKSATGYAWRTVVTRTCIVLAMAIGAWIGYSTLTLGGDEGGTFGTALLVETLVAIVTEGIVALLVELLPLRFLEGERVYAHSKALWGVLYFITLLVFVLAVVPWEGNWDALGSSLGFWIVVLAIFAAICVGIYVYFRRFAKTLEENEGEEEVSLGETTRHDHS